MPEQPATVCECIRAACAWVASRSRSVELDREALDAYAATLPDSVPATAPNPVIAPIEGDREQRAAFVVCLNAINFGSGWWPTIRKRPGHSGFFTIAAGLAERFRRAGAPSPRELIAISPGEIAAVVGQDADHPLMEDYAAALRDVGSHVIAEHGGRFLGVAEAADGSAPALADLLAEWSAFADEADYEGRPVPFFKRAQLVAADLDRDGIVALREGERLTAFADNLVPHVLRLDGVLRLDPALAASIDAGELLKHGSPAEVELRACAVHAVELLTVATDRRLCPAEIDLALWSRGGEPRYKAVPRPRCRNTAY